MDTIDNEREEHCKVPPSNDVSKEFANNSDEISTKKSESIPDQEKVIPSVNDTVEPFKKPLVLGSKGQTSKVSKNPIINEASENSEVKRCKGGDSKTNQQNSVSVPYTEPRWSSKNKEPYGLEVLKSGMIIENIDISSKPFFVFGRQSNCDIQLAHPTVSRHHAVLQHRAEADSTNDGENIYCKDAGIYIYDLGSTHGTFVNKEQIPKQRYIRLHVGHMLKFGGSTRSYIILGPETDIEKESDKSVSELKEEAKQKKNAKLNEELSSSTGKMDQDDEDQGIDWGLGEDADEETDLSENPFASTQNEELYLDDPKKSLRGWFEREGEDLEYIVEEKSFGQFLCQVKLPLDDAHGKTLVAEALVKGKKKEAVVQCALEACRILDRLGLLRQANHESRKRKVRNWEEDDFYESDEDTFLDRTGAVEKKREKRMRSAGKLETKAETYESLLKKHEDVMKRIKSIEEAIKEERRKGTPKENKEGEQAEEEDALDAFMSTLSSQKTNLDKVNIRKLKVCFAELQQEEVQIRKLINIARPTSMPEVLKPQQLSSSKAEDDKELNEENISSSHSKEQDKSRDHSQEVPAPKKEEIKTTDNQEKSGKQYVEHQEEDKKITKKDTNPEIPVHLEDTSLKNDNKIVESTNNLSDSETDDANVKPKVHGPIFKFKYGKTKESEAEETPELPVKNTPKKNKSKETKKSDEFDEDYSMWVPPDNQSGDGKTKLNEKYGY